MGSGRSWPSRCASSWPSTPTGPSSSACAAAGLTVESDEPPPARDGPLTGLSIVITGGLEAYTRDEAKRAVATAGGKATGSVSRSTAFVVAGVDPGSKLQKAEAAGVPVIDEARFVAILEGAEPPPERDGA